MRDWIVTVQYAVIYSYLTLSSYPLLFVILMPKYLIIYNFQLIHCAKLSFVSVPFSALCNTKCYLYLFRRHHLEDSVERFLSHIITVFIICLYIVLALIALNPPVSVSHCLCIARISVVITPSTGLHSNRDHETAVQNLLNVKLQTVIT